MASPAAVLSLLVKAEGIDKASRQIRSLDTDLDKSNRTGSKTASTFKKVGSVIGGIVAFDALRRGVGSAISEFEEARKVGALTSQVIKTTGGAANVTAKQVADLAGSISKKVGIDDEAIQSGANLLLTFKNIRNETGKGRDIFNQATAAAVDLSAAGFGSLESTSKQLGKALNDPVKGMTALGRSGVTFSEDQKKAIEALLATGKAADRVKAQQIILREVQSQVGGAAAAQATSFDHLKVTLGNLAEAAGAVLVPALNKAARFLSTLINQMIEGKSTGGAIISVFRTTGTVMGTVATAIASLVGWFRQHETVALALGAALSVVLAAFVGFKILAAVQAAIMAVRAAMLLLNASLFANPIGLVVLALAALAAGLVVAYRESATFRKIVETAFKAVKVAGEAAFGWLKNAVVNVVDFLRARWENIKTGVSTYWELYRRLIINPIRDAFSWLREAVGNIVGWLADRWATIREFTSSAWQAIRDRIINPVRTAAEAVRNALGGDGLLGWLRERFDDFKSVAERLTKPFVSAFEKIEGAVKSVIGWMDRVIDRVKSVVDWIGKIKIPKISIPFIGGGRGGGNVGPGGPRPASVDGFNDDAAAFGNVVTSGYRPGDPGYHGQNRARDYAGGNMLGFARYMAATFGKYLLELIHTPMGFGIKNGSVVPLGFWGSRVNADHYDHVHVALEQGGYLKRGGWAVVGERGPELAHLPTGASVYSNRDSQAMLGGAGGVTVNIAEQHVHDRFDEGRFAADIAWRVQTA